MSFSSHYFLTARKKNKDVQEYIDSASNLNSTSPRSNTNRSISSNQLEFFVLALPTTSKTRSTSSSATAVARPRRLPPIEAKLGSTDSSSSFLETTPRSTVPSVTPQKEVAAGSNSSENYFKSANRLPIRLNSSDSSPRHHIIPDQSKGQKDSPRTTQVLSEFKPPSVPNSSLFFYSGRPSDSSKEKPMSKLSVSSSQLVPPNTSHKNKKTQDAISVVEASYSPSNLTETADVSQLNAKRISPNDKPAQLPQSSSSSSSLSIATPAAASAPATSAVKKPKRPGKQMSVTKPVVSKETGLESNGSNKRVDAAKSVEQTNKKKHPSRASLSISKHSEQVKPQPSRTIVSELNPSKAATNSQMGMKVIGEQSELFVCQLFEDLPQPFSPMKHVDQRGGSASKSEKSNVNLVRSKTVKIVSDEDKKDKPVRIDANKQENENNQKKSNAGKTNDYDMDEFERDDGGSLAEENSLLSDAETQGNRKQTSKSNSIIVDSLLSKSELEREMVDSSHFEEMSSNPELVKRLKEMHKMILEHQISEDLSLVVPSTAQSSSLISDSDSLARKPPIYNNSPSGGKSNIRQVYAQANNSMKFSPKHRFDVNMDSMGYESNKSDWVDMENHQKMGYRVYFDKKTSWSRGNLIGCGAFGNVYKAWLNSCQFVAVKQIEMGGTDPIKAQKRYESVKEEVRILRELEHLNIVKFWDTQFDGNVVSIFMEYIPGGTIADHVVEFGILKEEFVQNFTRQICNGISFIHSKNVVHRDIKGKNIMLMSSGIIKLIDFGCAKRLKMNQNSNSIRTLLNSFKGTPYWMAPEVIRETGHGPKADIWSLGATVYEMATGTPPWSHLKPIPAMYAIAKLEEPAPGLPLDKFSPEAIDFVNKCLTREEKLRPSASELLNHKFLVEALKS